MPAPKDLNKYKNTVSIVDDEGTKKQGGFTTKVNTNSGLVKTGSFANKVDTTKTSGVPVTYTNANNVQNTGNNARTVTVTTGTPLNVNQTATQPTNTVATTPTVTSGVPTIATASQPVQSNQPSNVVSYMPSSTANTTTTREKPTYEEPIGTRESVKTPIDYKSIQSTYTPTQVSASTAKFEPSQQYLDAMASVQASLDKLMSGRTSYTDKINSSLKSIEDTAPFSYDFNSDPMFQQMLAGAMKSGKLAMEDSMGQAAALTGGYGSSYSGMVGQQAYNRYIDEAYDRIPDYWGMALSEYQQDLNNKYNLLNQYRASDDTEWNRNFDTFKSQYQMASDQWDRESNTYWNEQNFSENSRQWAESENDNRNRFAEAIRQYENDRAYQQYRDSVSDQQYQQAFDYNKYRDEMSDYYNDRNFDYQLNRDAISDARYDDQTAYERAIDERNFNYNASQDSIANALKQAQLSHSIAQDAKELQYKYDSLNWDKEQAEAKAKSSSENKSYKAWNNTVENQLRSAVKLYGNTEDLFNNIAYLYDTYSQDDIELALDKIFAEMDELSLDKSDGRLYDGYGNLQNLGLLGNSAAFKNATFTQVGNNKYQCRETGDTVTWEQLQAWYGDNASAHIVGVK